MTAVQSINQNIQSHACAYSLSHVDDGALLAELKPVLKSQVYFPKSHDGVLDKQRKTRIDVRLVSHNTFVKEVRRQISY